MTKQQLAPYFKEYWEYVKDVIGEDGWVYSNEVPHLLDFYFSQNTKTEIDFEKSYEGTWRGPRWRPKALALAISEIPTAEQLMLQNNGDDYTHFEEIAELMRYFAKIHVEAALKAASEKAKFFPISTWNCEPRGVQPEVNKQSILNAYPKEKII